MADDPNPDDLDQIVKYFTAPDVPNPDVRAAALGAHVAERDRWPLLQIREDWDRGWDVVVYLDGSYSSRKDAEASLVLAARDAASAWRRNHRRQLRAVCFSCRKDIPDGGGVIHVAHREVRRAEFDRISLCEQLAADAEEESEPDDLMEALLAECHAMPTPARWQVHCTACNPHREESCGGCERIAVEQCRTWSQLTAWTSALSKKGWVRDTDWFDFAETTALGTSESGLVCDPADRCPS